MNKTFVNIVSRVFEPLVVFFVILLAGAWRANLQGEKLWAYLISILALFILIFSLRLWMAIHWDLHWDLSERRKRIRPLIITIFVALLYWLVFRSWQQPVITSLFTLLGIWLLGFFFITLFYKISGHTSALTLAVGLTISWLGWQYWPLLLLLPLVGWARVKGKHHTPSQVVMGVFYSSVLLLFVFRP